jgi:hypothetical protein
MPRLREHRRIRRRRFPQRVRPGKRRLFTAFRYYSTAASGKS